MLSKNTIVFDIEADGLFHLPYSRVDEDRRVTRVHCICLKQTGGDIETYVSTPWPPFSEKELPSIEEGLRRLSSADVLVGHNIIRYDLRVLKDLYGWEPNKDTVIHDTLVMSHMGYTSLYEKDIRVAWNKEDLDFPKSLTGHHSLRAWGYRLGFHKGFVNGEEDYSKLTAEMLTYCARDVQLNEKLYQLFLKWYADMPKAVYMEHEFYMALEEMQEAGWMIDVDKGSSLVDELESQRLELENILLDVFPSRTVQPLNKGVVQQNPFWNPKQLKTKAKVYPFKPGSTIQVAYWLNKLYGWVPKKDGWTKTGKAKITDEVLALLPWGEARKLVRYAMLTKRLSSLVGLRGYLTLIDKDTGRLHGKINHCGTVTHRCSHHSPNLGNPTSVKREYGKALRSLFMAPPGYKIVGADAAGLELRMLANRMYPYDGGEYADVVVNGDPHEKNRVAAGLEDDGLLSGRDRAKTLIYGVTYGAGDTKVGMIAKPSGKHWDETKLRKEGKKLKKKLFDSIPALKQLINNLKKNFKVGQTIMGLDGRLAENRAAHQSLNTQLQMDGAVVMKWATVLLREKVEERGWSVGPDKDWVLVGHIHDEVQMQVKEELADEAGKLATESIREAGELLSLNCRLDANCAIGDSWADTH